MSARPEGRVKVRLSKLGACHDRFLGIGLDLAYVGEGFVGAVAIGASWLDVSALAAVGAFERVWAFTFSGLVVARAPSAP